MKMRNKGKVYPSPSSSSSLPSYAPPNRDPFSVLKLLPAAILALVSALTLEDREVLAYMVTRSMNSTNPSSIAEENRKNSKKSSAHKPPVFDCECFDCYTTYWFRWDSSPNRELIHQAIEAFEEHLNHGEQSKKNRGRKREKMGRRITDKLANLSEVPALEIVAHVPEIEDIFVQVIEKAVETSENGEDEVVEAQESLPEDAPPPETAVALRGTAANNHKGLVRKVLPDVLGLFNSRLWSLWSPNA